jgi:shikimate dehydrogenase
MTSRKLAVLGHPIDHSLSPALHGAAYKVLGLDWSYERADVTEIQLDEYVGSRDESWRGLSLTMPLKYRATEIADVVDADTALTGACNTLVFDHETNQKFGYNTDVAALASVIVDVSRELTAIGVGAGSDAGGSAVPAGIAILGGGATSVSAIVAAARAGVESVDIYVRDTNRASNAIVAAQAAGVLANVHDLATFGTVSAHSITICTLPGSVAVEVPLVGFSGRTLIDVAYAPWPTARAVAWQSAGGSAVSGLHMLVRQAVLQVRIFVSGSPEIVLDDENQVRAAMAAAVGLRELIEAAQQG